MRALFISIICFSITGCSTLGHYYSAEVMTINDKVCVMVPANKNEVLQSVTINERGNRKNKIEEYFDDNKGNVINIFPDKCMPDFEFKYEVGHAYLFHARTTVLDKVEEKERAADRNYEATFVVWEAAGKRQVSKIH